MDNGSNGLFPFIKSHFKEFSIGSAMGGLFSGAKLFLTTSGWTHLIGEWVVRLVFTVAIAALSGLATAWAKDAYENYKLYRKKKEKEHELRQRTKNRRDRAA